ncbi:unnamed protein product [Microthlaspi erraticum]|uniref:Reverse transcriptase domain-containing protein n=1 Tax=Microthlaspi erraticum TaxID=1685480 RepID=A0A6D2ILJ9_9BRAS|nr:unnamed protein product [Microthlaspi erraticum]
MIMVGDCYIPADFVVLELEHQPKDPLILGRPFLATAGAIIDVKNGKIDLHLGDIVMNFEVNKSMEKPTVDGQAFWIGELAETREEVLDELLLIDPLELALTKAENEYGYMEREAQCLVKFMDSKEAYKELIAYMDLEREEEEPDIDKEAKPKPKGSCQEGDNEAIESWSDYPISDSAWVSPVHVVPKKGGITVIKNEHDELIPTRTITGHRMCVDYRKLNSSTRKDHYPLPFIDQMLERLANHQYYCFLDGYSGFFQIPIHPDDQEKTTFTCPYGTYAYRRMPFGLCNAPATFQRCMMSIFTDLIEEIMEVFMDDFSVYGSSFESCLGKSWKSATEM